MSTYRRSVLPEEYSAGVLSQEFERVEQALQNPDTITLTELHVAPAKPRTGMVALAAGFPDWDPPGTGVNPGDNQGVYAYYAGAWHLLG